MKNYTRISSKLIWKKHKFFTFSVLLFGTFVANAQQATVPSGGNATGTGGNVSYTIGQIAYNTQTAALGTVTQGVQQPIEIIALNGQEFANIKLEAIVYPNPTAATLTLKISDLSLENLSYEFFDMQGKTILQGKISNSETVFDLEKYPFATYLLKINSNAKPLKNFKIIKN